MKLTIKRVRSVAVVSWQGKEYVHGWRVYCPCCDHGWYQWRWDMTILTVRNHIAWHGRHDAR